MKYLERVRKALGNEAIAACAAKDQLAIQNILAPVLRKAAIKHLAEGEGVIAQGFRGAYIPSTDMPQTSYRQFLNKQAGNGVWATYIEAIALGELFERTVVVTPVVNGVEQEPICLYRAQNDDEGIIHLYNSNNNHWFVDADTRANGNCLYNAFAQSLHPTISLAIPAEAKSNQIDLITASQRAIEAAIARQSTPEELEQNCLIEKERISQLPKAIQDQIRSDYELALSLAGEEMSYQHHHLFASQQSSEKQESIIKPRM